MAATLWFAGAVVAAPQGWDMFTSTAGVQAAPAKPAPVEVAPSPLDLRLGEAETQQYRLGIVVRAASGPCKGIVASAPLPIDWPEQQVQEVAADVSPQVANLGFRQVAPSVRQMIMEVPRLEAGEEAHAILTYEITRHALAAPETTAGLEIPKKVERDIRPFLGPSPGIEVRHAKIRQLAKEIADTKESAWEKVEAIYDWVRENVEYKNGAFKGAAAALKDKFGDCEELSSLFIAMCRSQNIPARTVWVPGHCYPEFYLTEDDGRGHWYPCQAAGTRAFGGIPELRPILQKGDNFITPERPREKLRYVSEYLTGAGGQPQVEFIRELVGGPGTAAPAPATQAEPAQNGGAPRNR